MSDQLQLEDEAIPIALRRAWERALRVLGTRLNTPTFETHIRSLRPLSLLEESDAQEGRRGFLATLGVASAFSREWIERRHALLIAELLGEALGSPVRLKIVLLPKTSRPSGGTILKGGAARPLPTPSTTTDLSETSASLTAPPFSPSKEIVAPDPAHLLVPRRDNLPANGQSSSKAFVVGTGLEIVPLNRKFTFDTFVSGTSNRLAQAGSLRVAEAPGVVYNPLFLYGPSGLGKTHLMHAIGNHIVEQGGAGRVACISGEAFTALYVNSLRHHSTEDFRKRWRSVDVWLVDDIQFIAGKEKTKEEFFHTFNTLHQMGKQIVVCSDRSPRDLQMMDERLRSRFECGLMADIVPPDLETRLAILQRKAGDESAFISDEVLLYMARLVQSNIRTLEGALTRLVAHASLSRSPITIELATQVLGRYYIQPEGSLFTQDGNTSSAKPTHDTNIAAREIAQRAIRLAAKEYGQTVEAIRGKSRSQAIMQARQSAIYLAREVSHLSFAEIGTLLDRDHSTVIYSHGKVKAQVSNDAELRAVIERLMAQLETE